MFFAALACVRCGRRLSGERGGSVRHGAEADGVGRQHVLQGRAEQSGETADNHGEI